MLAIISPAKNMSDQHTGGIAATRPAFLPEAARLAQALQELSPWQLEGPMAVSPQLAMKAFEQLARWGQEGGAPALLAYQGLQYRYLEPDTLGPEELDYLQEHLRILSALYGVLRPLDAIRPYRLEMQAKLRFEGKNLYQWWGDRVHRALFAQDDLVLNLASAEYSRMVEPFLRPGERLVRCDFVTVRGGRASTVATTAKMARGKMARFLARRRPDCPEQLAEFDWEGFCYEPALSARDRMVFLRRP